MAKQEWNLRPAKDWSHSVHLLSSLITVGAAFWALLAQKDSSAIIYAAALSIITLVSFWQAQRYMMFKRHRYALVIEHMHCIVHTIRDAASELLLLKCRRGFTEVDFERLHLLTIDSVLTTVANAFAIVTGQTCAVCVKAIDSESDESCFTVTTFSRDKLSAVAGRGESDSVATGIPIFENTAFRNILKGKRFFISNNLPALWSKGKYQNTSFKYHGDPRQRGFFARRILFRAPIWPLPYRSTMVVPIRYILRDEGPFCGSKEDTSVNYFGFLCVDSRSSNVFSQHESLMLMGMVADSLFLFTQISHRVLDDDPAEVEE